MAHKDASSILRFRLPRKGLIIRMDRGARGAAIEDADHSIQ